MPPRRQHPLAVTVAELGPLHDAFDWLSANGFRGVQLSATQAATRPRDLGASARRDLRATLSRLELAASGIDAWIPPSHFVDPSTMDRAVEAACAACGLAGELGAAAVTLQFPPVSAGPDAARRAQAVAAIAAEADRAGVLVADAGGGAEAPWPPVGISFDPAAALAQGTDPAAGAAAASSRLVSARIADLLRTGMRGPPGTADGRLDVLAYRIALETAGLRGIPVVDARQWADPRAGALMAASSWQACVPE